MFFRHPVGPIRLLSAITLAAIVPAYRINMAITWDKVQCSVLLVTQGKVLVGSTGIDQDKALGLYPVCYKKTLKIAYKRSIKINTS